MLSPTHILAWLKPAGAALLAAACLTACDKPPEKPLTHNVPVSIANRVQVLNADTLVIDGRHVHLSNASAPEGALHARCWAEAMMAADDVAYVKELVAHAMRIDFTPTGQLDDYNRALGEVRLDGVDLGDELYARGLAARLTSPRFDWCQPISQAAEGAPPIESVINLSQ